MKFNEKAINSIMKWIILALVVLIIIPVTFHIGQLLWGIIILFFTFWMTMLVDCLQRNENDFPSKGQNEKLIWSMVLIFLNLIGAFLYFVLVFTKYNEVTDLQVSKNMN
ncbi:Phospholipase_D-nuclease N-terminal [Methanolobus vulcani]|jgi:4-hydroxybenzoate polyprenyltransferase|uniref:Phospholipase_D-nuclease N-terminal n=1 Tax=Methanolobus vulcani TaxID=38026 RepID=A0A7Z7FD91_9EURY|nr:PLDc N-terminal domain-containing protein [Methanolobus vulcani]SDF32364.1 Phospholipase_D-nuclease N-terminal [Methanolobus vulcani]